MFLADSADLVLLVAGDDEIRGIRSTMSTSPMRLGLAVIVFNGGDNLFVISPSSDRHVVNQVLRHSFAWPRGCAVTRALRYRPDSFLRLRTVARNAGPWPCPVARRLG